MRAPRTQLFRLFLIAYFAASSASCAFGQASVGVQKFGAYEGSIDTVDLGTLIVQLDLPLYSKGGRGSGTAIRISLSTGNPWNIQPTLSFPSLKPWITSGVTLPGNPSSKTTYVTCEALRQPIQYRRISWTWTDASGNAHTFPGYTIAAGQCANYGVHDTTLTASASDGSGFLINVTAAGPPTITDPSGRIFSWNPHPTIQDSNGNILTYTVNYNNGNLSPQDTVNSSINLTATPYATSINYTDDQGNPQSIAISYKQYTYGTSYENMVDTITYPDGSSYHITYALDSGGTLDGTMGAVASITLPTGGVISYTYPNGFVIDCYLGYIATALTRTTSDGTTTYTRTAPNGGPCTSTAPENSTTTITKPNGDKILVYFTTPLISPSGTPFPDSKTFETKRVEYDHSNLNTPIRTTMRCYDGATGDCTTTAVNEPVTQLAVSTTLENGMSSKVVTNYNAMSLPTEVDEYDFGASSPTRKTITTYASLGNNISDRPASVIVYDSAGNIAKKTTYAYDETTPAPMTLPGHTTVSGSRGNPTSVYNWIVSSGQSLRTQYTYDDAGQVTALTDPKGNTTSYAYDSATDAYRTKITRPTTNSVAHVSTFGYGPNSGLVTSSHDENNQLTSYTFDSLTAMCDGAGAESWSHDVMGRVLTDSRTTNSVTKSTVYTYLPYVDGSINSITHPSGRTLTYSTGAAERLLTLQDNSTSVYYANSALYAPQGAMSSLTNGPNLYSTYVYNSRFQPCWLYTTTGTALAANSACTATAATGNIRDFKLNFSLGASDNGNVVGITNNRDTTRSQTVSYDSLNRIAIAETTSTHGTSPANCWGEAYFYDNLTTAGGAWGNLTTVTSPSSAYTGCTSESLSVTALTNNRLSGFGYDAPTS